MVTLFNTFRLFNEYNILYYSRALANTYGSGGDVAGKEDKEYILYALDELINSAKIKAL